MKIKVSHLSWGVKNKHIIEDISFSVASGETIGIIGPNGSGKSSVLRCVAGLRSPCKGNIYYDDFDISQWSTRKIAQNVAFVEQSPATDTDLQVKDIIALARTPFLNKWHGLQISDWDIVDDAIHTMELDELQYQHWSTISGGARQRTHIARAIAQQPRAIFLDEPTNHLDIKHQFDLMRLISTTPQTIIVVLHDLSLASRFCDRLILMNQGHITAIGTPAQVLTPEKINNVFSIPTEITYNQLNHLTITYL